MSGFDFKDVTTLISTNSKKNQVDRIRTEKYTGFRHFNQARCYKRSHPA